VRRRLGLATRTQISVCKSPFPSAGTAVIIIIIISTFINSARVTQCHNGGVPIPCENGSAETTVAEGGRTYIVGMILFGRFCLLTLLLYLCRGFTCANSNLVKCYGSTLCFYDVEFPVCRS